MVSKHRYLLPATFVLCSVLLLNGCGGSAPGAANNDNNSSNPDNGARTVTVTAQPSGVTATSDRVMVTATVTGPADPTLRYTWTVLGPITIGNGTLQLVAPGSQGHLETLSGQVLTGAPIEDSTVVYVADPAKLTFGGYDVVSVVLTGESYGTGSSSAFRSNSIATTSDFVTLPPPVTSACGSVELAATTVKPGSPVTAKVSFTPTSICGNIATLDTVGFLPSGIAVNGNNATAPITFTGPLNTPISMQTVDLGIPSDYGDEFPVSASIAGITGSWVRLSGSGVNGPWLVYAPFFIKK